MPRGDKVDRELRAQMKKSAKEFTRANMQHPDTPGKSGRELMARVRLRNAERMLKERSEPKEESRRVRLLKEQADRRYGIKRNK